MGNGGKKILKKQLVMLGIVVLLICVGLSGCGEQKNKGNIEMFIGIWEMMEGNPPFVNSTWEFHNNGSFKTTNVYWSHNFSNKTSTHTQVIWSLWDIETGSLFLNSKPGSEGGFNTCFDYYFSNDGGTLTLKSFGNIQWGVLNKID